MVAAKQEVPELTGEPGEADSHPGEARPGARRSWIRRIFLWAIVLAMLLGSVPALLGLFYRIEGVRPVSTLMLARWMTLADVDRRWIEIDDIAPVLVNSVIMSEDGQFCSHRGIDWNELNAVIDDALEGEATRGASTITMQTAKNLFLWNSRSILRKGLELPIAFYLDGVLSKKRIMEIYLNIAEWGDGIFGIEAAAQHHFGKSASRLTAREAALLTVTLPAPLKRDPAKAGPGLRRLAGIIERRASRAGGYVGCVR